MAAGGGVLGVGGVTGFTSLLAGVLSVGVGGTTGGVTCLAGSVVVEPGLDGLDAGFSGSGGLAGVGTIFSEGAGGLIGAGVGTTVGLSLEEGGLGDTGVGTTGGYG